MTKQYYNRNIDNELLVWKDEENRKPLLLRGARQVGKSSSIRKLAEKFDIFLEINFEKNRNLYRFFDGDLDVKEICANLSAHFQKPVIPGKTLLFLDEIQAEYGIRTSLENFSEYDKIRVYPLYAIGNLNN